MAQNNKVYNTESKLINNNLYTCVIAWSKNLAKWYEPSACASELIDVLSWQ